MQRIRRWEFSEFMIRRFVAQWSRWNTSGVLPGHWRFRFSGVTISVKSFLDLSGWILQLDDGVREEDDERHRDDISTCHGDSAEEVVEQ